MMNFFEIKNLNYEVREKKILKNININFQAGKFYSIIGPNGSGKTTFIKHLIKGIEAKNNIYLDGKSLSGYKAKDFARKISYVPQIISYEIDFSCFDVVMMGRNYAQNSLFRVDNKDIKKVEEAMKATDTYFLKDVSINDISGGERGRVILARALCQEAECIILDEPLAHLDINHQINMMRMLKEINKRLNKTIIMVNHDINLAIKYSDKIIVFNKGEIERECTPNDILDKELLNNVYRLNLKDENINKEEFFINFY
jgi:iron complex transport system ATP-binding protein